MTDEHPKPASLTAVGSPFHGPPVRDPSTGKWTRVVYVVSGHVWIEREGRWSESLVFVGVESCEPGPCPTCGQMWP